MTARETIVYIKTSLVPLYDEREAEQIARMVAAQRGGIPPAQLSVDPDGPLEIEGLEGLVAELAAGRPVQYVLGRTEFCGLDFAVREGVLIPRPETEELVRWIAREAGTAPAILDIGTGSGAIAVSLARLIPAARITAIDISREALAVAAENARKLGARVDFRQEDALQEIFPEQSAAFDIIVSNPPYVPLSRRAAMHRNVTDYEPAAALFVSDDDPLIFYRAIARQARRLLGKDGRLYFEIDDHSADRMRRLLHDEGFARTDIRKDIHDKNRMTCSLRK